MDARFNHLAGLICRNFPLEPAAKIANEINNTLDGFSSFFLMYWALEKAGVPNKRGKKGTIYFMRDTANGDVKIGFSDGQVAARSKFHTISRQTPVETLFQFQGHYADETKCHEMFQKHNIGGEWYKGSEHVMEAIAAMNQEATDNPSFTACDLITAAGWVLHFWGKEAEHYKAVFTLVKADLDRFAESLMLDGSKKLTHKH